MKISVHDEMNAQLTSESKKELSEDVKADSTNAVTQYADCRKALPVFRVRDM